MSIRIAIIGLGRIGFLLENDPLRYHPCTHAGALRDVINERVPESRPRLVGICDLLPERIKQFREWWGEEIPFSSTDYRELIDTSAPDLLIISSSLPSHFEIASYALNAGVLCMMLEKPAASQIDEVRSLVSLEAERQAAIWVNYERRYHPAYRHVKQFIESKRFGRLRAIRGTVLTGPVRPEDDGGPLLLDGIHWIDLLLWLCGKPEATTSVAFPSRIPGRFDTAFLQFRYPGWVATLESGGRRNYFEFAIELDFEQGRIKSGNGGHTFYESSPSRLYENFRDLTPIDEPIPTGNPWIEMYREILSGAEKMVAEGSVSREAISSPLADSVSALSIIESVEGKPGTIPF